MTSGDATSGAGRTTTPVLLLKTRSAPTDAYHDLLSASEHAFCPRFIPVLQHRFEEPGLSRLRSVLRDRRVSANPESPSSSSSSSYGGLIFTSQRAVEAFAKLVQDEHPEGGEDSPAEPDDAWPHLQHVPVYSVGPATTRALRAIPQSPTPLRVFGEHTGNGDALAHFILDHYAGWYPGRDPPPPLLFPVGEQRRDVIPRTLSNGGGDPSRAAIRVDEEVVYGTGVMESFPSDFATVLRETSDSPTRWVVVFSPTGCESMLRTLDILDPETGRAREGGGRRGGTYVAAIGPTTQNYLRSSFGFEPDVCAPSPSPEGVLQGILDFSRHLQSST